MEVEGLELGAAELGPLEGSDQKLEAEEEQEESEEAAGGSKKRVVPGIVPFSLGMGLSSICQ